MDPSTSLSFLPLSITIHYLPKHPTSRLRLPNVPVSDQFWLRRTCHRVFGEDENATFPTLTLSLIEDSYQECLKRLSTSDDSILAVDLDDIVLWDSYWNTWRSLSYDLSVPKQITDMFSRSYIHGMAADLAENKSNDA
ncbi:unnamed protein product [Aspergillus oryzae RIB40]|uniref:DNA, SC001 n=2 Tax=Aspergillus oryzae TaxID=5062 RepID=Q2UNL4_ASPOR|nr:unnamed protein product [Aspergillus oryzae RIB40]EIT72463.1 hypothetical protein Ao3042_01312 [Aspergillus oryzae 3.042]KDE83866.1 hypothetical protein AO1008_10459 [Aspergillus oryzae 100-8]BAE56851.1 unnamed protein product [Aspergillus oryzae RIB40]|eukprot:EIT72463.1 hypothetical protein Ao3042_01312 [Aspergillus oryzae 3.042]